MMITRFNAECKKRPEGGGKFAAKERLGMGAASAMGIACGIAEEEFDISRTRYYDLRKKADCALESLGALEETTERAIVASKAFRERFVLALACYGNASAFNIVAICRQAFQAPLSKGSAVPLISTLSQYCKTGAFQTAGKNRNKRFGMSDRAQTIGISRRAPWPSPLFPFR